MLSRQDKLGLTALGVMAASLPVMISEHVGARDLMRNGENGSIIGKTMNPDEIADTISLLVNEDTTLRIGREAQSTVSKHSWEICTEIKVAYDLCTK